MSVSAIIAMGLVTLVVNYGLNKIIDEFQCQHSPDPTHPYRPHPEESPTQAYTKQYYDPIVLDLNGNGVGMVSKFGYHGAMFDHSGDGIATATGWVDRSDGLLVRDINTNGKIDNGTELFGDNTKLKNGQKATSGMEALADLDENNDGVVDINDTVFAEQLIIAYIFGYC